MEYPILGEDSKDNTIPTDGKCPVCGAELSDTGFAFFIAGAMPVDKHGNTLVHKRLKLASYFSIGFHGNECFPSHVEEGKDETYLNMDIVRFCKNGDFEFNFCSITCMKAWLNTIFDDFAKRFREENVLEKNMVMSLRENSFRYYVPSNGTNRCEKRTELSINSKMFMSH